MMIYLHKETADKVVKKVLDEVSNTKLSEHDIWQVLEKVTEQYKDKPLTIEQEQELTDYIVSETVILALNIYLYQKQQIIAKNIYQSKDSDNQPS